ncbi:Aryl sulfotransferase [hydrothermal vent metagenome]|uniref:Aryl sulfotransferase n=1 Tax=hydrothermal vent metagenome TaxID=652676 RepID=A0A3B0VZE0_9ZZZZ
MGNILWIASYPKSGNTWVRAFIHNYLANQVSHINSIHQQSIDEVKSFRYQKYLPENQNTTDLDLETLCSIRPFVHREIAAAANGTAFVKSHNFQGQYKNHPLHNWSVSSGAIYIVRNPLDVAVSLSHYFGYSIDEAIEYMADDMAGTPNEPENVPQVITSWSLNVSSWSQKPSDNLLVLRYEDLLSNPKKHFRKVESLLGLKKDPKRLMQAIKASSFNNLKKQEQSTGFVEKHEDAKSFFRKGTANQWKTELSEQQIKKIIDNHGEQMTRFKYLPAGY